MFTVFPNVSSLCINSTAWLELEACLNPAGWELFDGRKGLKIFRAYLSLVDPTLTISTIACLLTRSMVLSELSFLIHDEVAGYVSKSFMSKCMAQWPRLKWRWGIWSEYEEDSWIAERISQ